MKSLIHFRASLVSAAVLGASGIGAGAAVSLNEQTTLFINSSAGVEYHTNVFRAPNDEQSETAFFVRPGVELTYGGQGAPAVARLVAGWEIRRHDNFSELNGEHARINFDTTYDTGVTLFTAHASYNEYGTSSRADDPADTLTELVPVLAEREEGRLGANVRYSVSERLGLGVGGEYWVRTYDNYPTGRTLVDLERVDVPLRLFYNVAPRMDAVVGYRFRDVQAGDTPAGVIPPEYRDHYFFVGFDGQIFNPLWRASADIGYQERNYRNSLIDSSDALTANARITYAADANRSYYLLVSRDFFVSPVNAQNFIKNQITLGANYRMNEMWSFIGAVNFASTRYEDIRRDEDLFFLLGGVTYSPNEYLSVSARVRLTTVDGTGTNAIDYDNEFISVSASLRY